MKLPLSTVNCFCSLQNFISLLKTVQYLLVIFNLKSTFLCKVSEHVHNLVPDQGTNLMLVLLLFALYVSDSKKWPLLLNLCLLKTEAQHFLLSPSYFLFILKFYCRHHLFQKTFDKSKNSICFAQHSILCLIRDPGICQILIK